MHKRAIADCVMNTHKHSHAHTLHQLCHICLSHRDWASIDRRYSLFNSFKSNWTETLNWIRFNWILSVDHCKIMAGNVLEIWFKILRPILLNKFQLKYEKMEFLLVAAVYLYFSTNHSKYVTQESKSKWQFELFYESWRRGCSRWNRQRKQNLLSVVFGTHSLSLVSAWRWFCITHSFHTNETKKRIETNDSSTSSIIWQQINI